MTSPRALLLGIDRGTIARRMHALGMGGGKS